MLKRLLLFLLVCSFSSVAFAQSDTPRKAVIIDTDMAFEDWIAILFLLQHPDIEVLAITVNGTGEAHCAPGVQNMLNLLLLADESDIPVSCGRETPLQGDHVFPDVWRDDVDALSGITLPVSDAAPSPLSAPELLIEQINASAENITLITLGALTNVAEAFQAEPTLVDKIDRIYIMGGAVGVIGNLYTDNTTAEWNLYIDPLAVDIVFEAGAPITLVGLDATNRVPMTLDFYHRLEQDRSTPEADFVYQAMTANLEDITLGYLSFWDTLTSVSVTDASVISVQGRPISVITDEGAESGRTIVDENGVRMDVAVGADAAAFEPILLNVLNGRAPDAAPPAQTAIAEGSEENAEIVRRYYEEAWGAQNLDVLLELLDPAYLHHINSDTYVGGSESISDTIGSLHTIMPDVRLTVAEIVAVDETVVIRVLMQGTHTGNYLSIAPTNNPIAVTINSILHMRDGRIIEEWQTFDFLGLLFGMEAIPVEALQALYGEGE